MPHPETTKCPACGGNDAEIKRRRGGVYLECVAPCYFMGPTAATVPQAMAGARRVADKRKKEVAPDPIVAAWDAFEAAQAEHDRNYGEFTRWERMTDRERDDEIKRAMR